MGASFRSRKLPLKKLGLPAVGVATALLATAVLPGVTRAQVVPDATLGNENSTITSNTLVQGTIADLIQGGATRGSNLFHSFELFNIGEGQQVYFANPAGIESIFSRITGSDPSTILGSLGIEGGADLFLLNPNGIVFGENSALNVEGSFIATTADAVVFPSNEVFSALNPNSPSSLLTVNPSALLFSQIEAAPIENRSVTTGFDFNTFLLTYGLTVPSGNSLILLGGDILMDGGQLTASSGSLGLGSIQSAGRIPLSFAGGFPGITVPQGITRGDVSLVNGAQLNTVGTGGGHIEIFARDFLLDNQSNISSGIGSFLSAAEAAGDIVIDADGMVTIFSGSAVQNSVGTFATGNAGNISIVADGNVTVSEGSSVKNLGSIASTGNVGDIRIVGNNLIVLGAVEISAVNTGSGSVGNVTLQAFENITVQGPDPSSPPNHQTQLPSRALLLTSVSALAGSPVPGDSTIGNLTLQAQNLTITGNTRLSTNSVGLNPVVTSGNLALLIDNDIVLEGDGVELRADTSGAGDAGSILIETGSFFARDGARLSAGTFGSGQGGNIEIQADDVISFSGVSDNFISSSALVATDAEGDSGNISLNSRVLSVTDGAQILADTLPPFFGTGTTGDAGDIIITADRVLLEGVNRNFFNSGIFATSQAGAGGRSGNVVITTDELTLRAGAQLAVGTGSNSNAGDIRIVATGPVLIDGVGSNRTATAISAETGQDSTGQGGLINIRAHSLQLSNGGEIRTASEGTGRGGNIVLTLDDTLLIDDALVSSSAARSAGGDIQASAQRIRLVGDGDITTSVFTGQGGGGNIQLTAGTIIALGDSDILAFSADGFGGNILLDTPAFFGENFQPAPQLTTQEQLQALNGNDRVDVNATGGIAAGTITLPDVSFIATSLTELEDTTVDTDSLTAGSCIARSEVSQGSFVVTGGDGLPLRPGDISISAYPTGTVQRVESGTISRSSFIPEGDVLQEPDGVYQLPDGRLVLGRECE